MSDAGLVGGTRVPGIVSEQVEYRSARIGKRGAEGDVAYKCTSAGVTDPRTLVTSDIYPGLVLVTDPTTDTVVTAVEGTSYAVQASLLATSAVAAGGLLIIQDGHGEEILRYTVIGVNDAAVLAEVNTPGNALGEYFIADTSTGRLRLTLKRNKGLGAEGEIKASGAFATAVGFSTSTQQGTDPDYAITDHGGVGPLVIGGTARNRSLNCALFGDFWEARVHNLTTEARRIFLKRGCTFRARS